MKLHLECAGIDIVVLLANAIQEIFLLILLTAFCHLHEWHLQPCFSINIHNTKHFNLMRPADLHKDSPFGSFI